MPFDELIGMQKQTIILLRPPHFGCVHNPMLINLVAEDTPSTFASVAHYAMELRRFSGYFKNIKENSTGKHGVCGNPTYSPKLSDSFCKFIFVFW
jgi:hypothetical protein